MTAKPNNVAPKARAPAKPRTRAPVPVILRLRQDLAPNESHPLSGIDPERRNADRQQLIASILARLASGPSLNSGKLDIMSEAARIEPQSGEQTTEAR